MKTGKVCCSHISKWIQNNHTKENCEMCELTLHRIMLNNVAIKSNDHNNYVYIKGYQNVINIIVPTALWFAVNGSYHCVKEICVINNI